MTGVLPHRALGASGIDVSVLSLGSWMTFEHMSREAGLAVMRAARECGHRLPRRRAVRRPHRHRADPHRVLRGAVRGSVPRVGLATRGRHRREQALARVLARREPRRRARRFAPAHGLRLPRPRLLRVAAATVARSPISSTTSARSWRRARRVRGESSTGRRRCCTTRARSRATAGWRLRARPSSRTASCRGRRSRTPRRWPHSTDASVSVVASAVLAGGALSGKYRDGARPGSVGGSRRRARGSHRRCRPPKRSARSPTRWAPRPPRSRSPSRCRIRRWRACCSVRRRRSRSSRTSRALDVLVVATDAQTRRAP